jgi:hypothetical protein
VAKRYGKSGFVGDFAGQENKANSNGRIQKSEDKRKKLKIKSVPVSPQRSSGG